MTSIHELTAIRDSLLQQVEALNAIIESSDEKRLFVTIEGHGRVPALEVQTLARQDQLDIASEWYGDDAAEAEIDNSEIVRVRLPDGTKPEPTDDFVLDGQQVWTHTHRADVSSS